MAILRTSSLYHLKAVSCMGISNSFNGIIKGQKHAFASALLIYRTPVGGTISNQNMKRRIKYFLYSKCHKNRSEFEIKP